MKKYYTPEIELEIISTSDICTGSGNLESVFTAFGESPTVSWNDDSKWE